MEDNRCSSDGLPEEAEGEAGDGAEAMMELRLRKSASSRRRSPSKDCCVV